MLVFWIDAWITIVGTVSDVEREEFGWWSSTEAARGFVWGDV